MYRLHNATVLSAAAESDLESDERLAMLFEGFLGGSGPDGHGGLTAPILFDAGASPNFVCPRFLKQAAISYSSSSATVTTYELYPRSGGVEITPQYVCSRILAAAQGTCQSQISYISNAVTHPGNSDPG